MVMVVNLQDFTASNSALNPKRLAPGIGVNASNLDVRQGDFRGLRAATTAQSLSVGSQKNSLYRFGRDTPSDVGIWLTFDNPIDWARILLNSDPKEITILSGSSLAAPIEIDSDLVDGSVLTAPSYFGRPIGMAIPPTGMVAAVAVAGAGTSETRVYCTTRVGDAPLSKEGAPSPSVTIVCPAGSTVTLSSIPNTPSLDYVDDGSFHRIYVSTGGDFRECGQITYATTTFTDDGVTRGSVLQSGGSATKPTWLPPATVMVGVTELWAGMLGGVEHDGKRYATCVPYKHWAWPAEFRRTIPDKIVGSAKWGQNWFLATTGKPRVVMGTTPLAMVDSPIYFKQACVSKRSVVGVDHGVCWASAAGLCYHGQKGTLNLTERILTRAQWQALVPETIIGANWGDWYVGFYNDGTRRGFMINVNKVEGIIWLTQGAFAVFEDPISETLFLLDSSNVVKKWDNGSVASATFKSKVFRHPQAVSPGAARVVATTYPLTFSLWADGVLQVNARSVTSDAPFRLPCGYVAEEFQVQIVGTGPVEGVFVAEEMADLP